MISVSLLFMRKNKLFMTAAKESFISFVYVTEPLPLCKKYKRFHFVIVTETA